MKNQSKFLWLLFLSFIYHLNCFAQTDTSIYEIDIKDLVNKSMRKSYILGLPHPHSKNEFMISYQYLSMFSEKLHSGNKFIEPTSLLNEFQIVPTKMTEQMHMGMFMYSFTDRLTLYSMFTHTTKNMEYIYRENNDIKYEKLKVKSFSDVDLYLSFPIYNYDYHVLLGSFGTSIPTGNIDLKGKMLMNSDETRLDYPMQIGSGTFDPILSLTYLGQTMKWSYGINLLTRQRLYKNKFDYNIGDLYEFNCGVAYDWSNWISNTIRFDYIKKLNYEGMDNSLDMMMSPTARPDMQGFNRFNLSAGMVLEIPKGTFKGNSFSIDFRKVLYEKMQGYQLSSEYYFLLSWQWIFGLNTL